MVRNYNTRKATNKYKEICDKNKNNHREIANKMLEQSKKDLIPIMRKKVNQVAKKIEELSKKDDGLLTTQIELIISNRSLYDIASSSKQRQYTSEELMIGLEMYRQIIAKINEKFTYPPSVFTFCGFMNMSTTCYKNYKSDPDKSEVMQMIDDYIAGIQFSSAQVGKLKEITTIFGLKSLHGFFEAPAPITVKQEISVDIDEIQSQIKALNRGKAIDVEYEEK